MRLTKGQIYEIMKNERYPLTLKYNFDWIIENAMGSHCLWLQESLTQAMNIRPDMRILDMGCGKAISSIFLAKEFGTQVWATDLWISSSDNWKRIREMGVDNMVFPIQADANSLPYPDEFFDAMLSVNSIFFYATEESFLKNHLIRHVKPGGEIGIVVPGFYREYNDGIPDNLKPYWADELNNWHTLDWWEYHLNNSGMVDIITADTLPDNEGNILYKKSAKIFNAHEEPFNVLAGENITFIRIIAKRKP
jgi:SAM-dependent methyltransferase